MSAVLGVPEEAIEAVWAADSLLSEYLVDDHAGHESWAKARLGRALAAALPSLREQIAAEVLGPVRALADEWALSPSPHKASRSRDLRAALSASVQAAEHVHEWVDATNPAVTGTDMCLTCPAVRAQAAEESE